MAKDRNRSDSPTAGYEEPRAGEVDFEHQLGEDLKSAQQILLSESPLEGQGNAAWRAATEIVEKVKPVPWLLWVIIRAVYGRSGELGDPDPQTFSVVSNLIVHAANDRTLSRLRTEEGGEGKIVSLADAVDHIGSDVAGSLCFIHAVCRRVSTSLNERVWRPILDDALLRAHIGYHVGQIASGYGAGRGMLAGFAGRCGLAVQIASGDMSQAQKALSGLASGVEIGEVCREIYGCDPLQVAALSLIAGGASRDIAMGISSYSAEDQRAVPGSEQHRWLCLFSAIENMRMGRQAEISEDVWRTLGYDPAGKNDLLTRVQMVQRRGHGWRWVTQSLAGGDGAPAKAPNRAAKERS